MSLDILDVIPEQKREQKMIYEQILSPKKKMAPSGPGTGSLGLGLTAVPLNADQQRVLQLLSQDRNVFLTGPAGTGKTVTLLTAIEQARSKCLHREHCIGVTAATGSAALLLRGRTLHSYLGIGLGKRSAMELARETLGLAKKRALADKLRACSLLIIDEISMIHAELLDLVDQYLRIVRAEPRKPFGGIQVLLCGDFCQLPPVEGAYAFKAAVWKELDLECVHLTQLMRQSDDSEFRSLLQRIRQGHCSKEDAALLRALNNTTFPEHITPTRLYSINRDVDDINKQELAKLIAAHQKAGTPSLVQTFKLQIARGNPEQALRFAESSGIIPLLQLAVGAQVVLTVNLAPDEGRVNGSRGRVLGFSRDPATGTPGIVIEWVDGTSSTIGYQEIDTRDPDQGFGRESRPGSASGSGSSGSDMDTDIPNLKLKYIPLRLAWAITIHRAQGMTLDAVEMDLGQSIFEYGQAYTALSRARNLKSIRVVSVHAKAFRTHPDVLAFYSKGG